MNEDKEFRRSTDVALKEYLDRRVDDLTVSVKDRFTLNDSAIAKAERTMNERLNSMNEFRDALKDQAGRMATRIEVEKVDQVVQELQRAKANLDGRIVIFSIVVSVGVSAIVTVVVAALLQWLHK